MTLFPTVVYYVSLGLLCIFAVHRLYLTFVFLRSRRRRGQSNHSPDAVDRPAVTVQLPLYNERFVARRLLRAAAGLDYPRDKLEVQVLDDSTDDTSAIVAEEVDRLREAGIDASHIRRPSRDGFKAGALAEGLRRARGEFVAIFDADFIPGPSFLKDILPSFDSPDVGMVQARWDHMNGEQSLLTRAQALMLDAHFHVEHTARDARSLFLNFNGTAGVWRRAAIDDAGGWKSDTLTEDLDLSYRAQLGGWRFRYRGDLGVPAELPADASSFKAQQYRWAKGSTQTARKLLGKVLLSALSWEVKWESAFHLLANCSYILLFLLTLSFPLAALHRYERFGNAAAMFDLAVITFSLGALFSFLIASQAGRSPSKAFRRVPLVIALGVGLTINNAAAVVDGLLRQGGVFVRTPKAGNEAPSSMSRYLVEVRSLGLFEGMVAIYLTAMGFVLVRAGALSALPFLAVFAFGYGYVSFLSLSGFLRTARARSADTAYPANR